MKEHINGNFSRITAACIAVAISIGCFDVYCIAGSAGEAFADATPGSSAPIQYEDELEPVYIHGGFNPPDQARYAERKQAASRRMQRESNSDPDIWEVILRHQMLANEYGRISVDFKEQNTGDFFLAMAHRWGIGVWTFHGKDRFPRATIGPFKGAFRFDELLDLAFKDTGCAWYPLSDVYITYECNEKTYAAPPTTSWFIMLRWDTTGPKNSVVGNNLCDTGVVPCRFETEAACFDAMAALGAPSPPGSDPDADTPERAAMHTWLTRHGAQNWRPDKPYYIYSCSSAPPADRRYLDGNHFAWKR